MECFQLFSNREERKDLNGMRSHSRSRGAVLCAGAPVEEVRAYPHPILYIFAVLVAFAVGLSRSIMMLCLFRENSGNRQGGGSKGKREIVPLLCSILGLIYS